MDKISFIIPTFNRANVICRAVDSIASQTSKEWELIIVDDGSTDNTKERIQNYVKSEKVKYIYQEHVGVSAARNKGLELATGNHIIFLDSDDEFSPELLEELLAIDYQDFDLIFWYAKKIKKNTIEIWKPVKLEKIYNGLKASFLAGSVCYRKDLLIEAGGYDTNLKFGENYELGMRIAQNKKIKTTILPKIHLYYNVNTEFRPNSEPTIKLEALKYLLTKHIELYKKDSHSYSRLLYQMGYLNEKLGKDEEAMIKYRMASSIDKFYIKPTVKRLLYKLGLYNFS